MRASPAKSASFLTRALSSSGGRGWNLPDEPFADEPADAGRGGGPGPASEVWAGQGGQEDQPCLRARPALAERVFAEGRVGGFS